MMLLEGATYSDVAKRFKGEAGTMTTISRHWKAQHMVSRQLLAAKDIRDRKRGLELEECQKKVWNDAQEAIDLSLGRKAPPKNPYNLAVFGQCIAPQVKIIEVLAKVEEKPQSITQNNSINVSDLSKLSVDQLRALKEMKTALNADSNG